MTNTAHTHHSGQALARVATRLAASDQINVHPTERLASALAGGLAVAWGLGQGSAAGKLTALLGGGLVYRGVSGRCAVYRTLGVDTRDAHFATLRLPAALTPHPRHFDVNREVTIQKTPAQIYQAWKRPEVLRSVMEHIAEIEPISEQVSRWTLRDPLGRAHAFEVEVVEDVPNKLIRWASREQPSILEHGRLELRRAPGDRGSEVRLHLHFTRPSGWIGDLLAKVLGPIPGAFCQRALRNLRSLLEAGELPSLEKNPAARASAEV